MKTAANGSRLGTDKIMTTQTEENVVIEKTGNFATPFSAEPDMVSIRQRIDTFMADEKARGQYESVMAKGQALNEKQQRSCR